MLQTPNFHCAGTIPELVGPGLYDRTTAVIKSDEPLLDVGSVAPNLVGKIAAEEAPQFFCAGVFTIKKPTSGQLKPSSSLCCLMYRFDI